MSRIKSKNTKPERIVRKFLHGHGIGYRLHVNAYPGRPDLVLRKYNTVIFVNGCFWHGHKNCKYFVLPKSNVDFWIKKINGNIERDSKNINQLHSLGVSVVTIWECELKKNAQELTLTSLLKRLQEST